MNATEIRREKTKFYPATRLGDKLVTGQYEGYRQEQGVGPTVNDSDFCCW